MFKPYGEILSAVIMRNQGGFSLGFGFVCFKEADSAAKALASLNGREGLYVRQALKKNERELEIKRITEKFRNSMLKFNLYFKNFPIESTEDELKEFFSQFGEIKSLKVMRKRVEVAQSSSLSVDEESKSQSPSSQVLKPLGESLGFGFVSFNSIESAIRAKHECKNLQFKGRLLIVNQFEPKSVRQAHLLEARDKLKLEKHKMLMVPGVDPAKSD